MRALHLAEGAEAPRTLQATHELVQALQWRTWCKGFGREAASLGAANYEACRRVLGLGHQDTLASGRALADAFRQQGQYGPAAHILREALEIARRHRGVEDEESLSLGRELARALNAHGDHAGAAEVQQVVFDVRRRVEGWGDVATLEAGHQLAYHLHCCGSSAEAERLCQEVLRRTRQLLGVELVETQELLVLIRATLPRSCVSRLRWALVVLFLALACLLHLLFPVVVQSVSDGGL